VVVDADGAVDDLLAAIEDAGCRAILDATGDESLCARELSERCDLPLSTTYRKSTVSPASGCSRSGLASGRRVATPASTPAGSRASG
jgi:hypothetical protein